MSDKFEQKAIKVFEAYLNVTPDALKPIVYRQARYNIGDALTIMVNYQILMLSILDLLEYSEGSQEELVGKLLYLNAKVSSFVDRLAK